MKRQQRAEIIVLFTILCYSYGVFVVLLMSEYLTESVWWTHLVSLLTVTSDVHNVHAAGMGAVDEKKTSIHIDQKQQVFGWFSVVISKGGNCYQNWRSGEVLSEEVRQAGPGWKRNTTRCPFSKVGTDNSRGTKHQLLVGRALIQDSKTRKTSLSTF